MAIYPLAIRRTRRGGCTLLILSRLLPVSILLALIIYSTARCIRAHSPRQIPTRFPPPPGDGSSHSTVQHLIPPPQEKPFRTIDKHTLDIDGERYLYIKTLGKGYEGEVRLYLDTQPPGGRKVVIKTFFWGTRVNHLPGHLFGVFNPEVESWYRVVLRPINWMLAGSGLWGTVVKTWPVEIPATLWFGRSGRGENGLVSALDYFYVKNRFFGKHWLLVMPYYEDGTVDDLAFLVSRLGLRPYEVDAAYRRDFLRFLETLGRMHEDGYCHDDIKTDNIFLSATTPRPPSSLSNSTTMAMSWLVSDLGNVRERSHIWHYARPGPARPPLKLDSRADCRVVDTTRALKSYISFLTQATGDSLREEEFDWEFYRGRRGWSWVYWQFMLGPEVGGREKVESAGG
ncbi:hypothetical protein BGX38DRAFT_203544 [Terfezia claveryi]|nr:hypothetical protein BGX38DRAFT_203544 [Terfezia claveryi]